ncbi:MAG: 2-amino-4-hydroxy-6-hydroxymethyldihydropteridine diphosphokinase [Bacteroides sp.]|nr:2-amino-4-hydroxy-6-hydroxymethyldihydropteridine diphosphokinase [Bacteroides sp.]
MIDIHINIGSNSGHREALIERAVAAVVSAFSDAEEILRSDIIETPPWGFDSPNPFLNLGVLMRLKDDSCRDSESFSLSVFRRLQHIQHEIDPSPHRDASGGYIDRAVDIDLIAINDYIVETPGLTIPHPRMHLRDFVLIPMSRLSPRWLHPILHKTPGELLQEI